MLVSRIPITVEEPLETGLPIADEEGKLKEPLVPENAAKKIEGDARDLFHIIGQYQTESRMLWATHKCAIVSGVFGCFSLAVILLCVFVGGHVIAQDAVETTDIKIQEMHITSFDNCPKGHENACFWANITSSIDNRNPLAATIHSSDIDVKFGDETFGTLSLPTMELAAAATTKFSLAHRLVLITDQGAMDAFGAALMTKAGLAMAMSGRVTVSALGLKFKVRLDNEVRLTGLNGFQNPPAVVTESYVTRATKDTLTLGLVVELTNPSTFAIADVGGLRLELFHGGVKCGLAMSRSEHVALGRGVNSLAFDATLTRTAANREAVASLLSQFTQDRDTLVEMRGFAGTTGVGVLRGAMARLAMPQAIRGLATLQKHGFPRGALARPVSTASVDNNNATAPGAGADPAALARTAAALSQYQRSRSPRALPTMLQYAHSKVSWPQVAVDTAECGWATPERLCDGDDSSAPCATTTTGNDFWGMKAAAQVLVFNPLALPVRITAVEAAANLTMGDDPAEGYCDPAMRVYSGAAVGTDPDANPDADANANASRYAYGCLPDPVRFARMRRSGTAARPYLLEMAPYSYSALAQDMCVTAGFAPLLRDPDTAEPNPMQFLMNLVNRGGYIHNKFFPGVAGYGTPSFLRAPFEHPIALPVALWGKATVEIGGGGSGGGGDDAFEVELEIRERDVPGTMVIEMTKF